MFRPDSLRPPATTRDHGPPFSNAYLSLSIDSFNPVNTLIPRLTACEIRGPAGKSTSKRGHNHRNSIKNLEKMKQMNEKTVTRVGLDYFPPTIKIEYTKGKSREQYHCRIHMNKYFNQFTSGFHHMSPVEQSMEVKAIVNALVDKHSELQQVPSKTFERMVEKLYLRHTQNNTIADNGVGDEYRDEQTTVTVRCSGDATRDGTLDYTLDEALDRTLNGTLDATLDVTSTGGLSYDTQVSISDA
jgi:hypothetical protein